MKAGDILVVGDTHGCFAALQEAVLLYSPSMVLQCGDFGYSPKQGNPLPKQGFRDASGKLVPVHFCDGNHDDHAWLRSLRHSRPAPCLVAPGVFYQPRGSTITLPDGRTVLFAGGAASIDKAVPGNGADGLSQEVLIKEELGDAFLSTAHVDIVISHAAPSSVALPQGLDAEFYDPSRTVLEKILQCYTPSYWFCGHYHTQFSRRLGTCKFTALDCLPLVIYKSSAMPRGLALLPK